MNERIGVAFGSGGWKGLAHLGVLRALEELEIRPAAYAGTSAGALVAAAAAHQIQLKDLEHLAVRCQKRSLFRLDLGHLVRHGLRAQALYQASPLRDLCHDLFGTTTFKKLRTPALIGTVEALSGEPMWWGSPERSNISIADAVYASCAMPGLLPPGRVGSHLCMDGGLLDPLGIQGLDGLVDRIIVVDLGRSRGSISDPLEAPRASALWWSAQAMVMRHLARHVLSTWSGPPVQIVRPVLRGVHVLRADDPARVIQAGYEAALQCLSDSDDQEVETGDSHSIG